MVVTEKSLVLSSIKNLGLVFREKYTFEELFNAIKNLFESPLTEEGVRNFLYTTIQLDLLKKEGDYYSLTEEAVLSMKFLQSLQNAKNRKKIVN